MPALGCAALVIFWSLAVICGFFGYFTGLLAFYYRGQIGLFIFIGAFSLFFWGAAVLLFFYPFFAKDLQKRK